MSRFDLEPEGFDYQGNLMRPPSEHDSILIQATVGCSHNKCAFCNAYRDKRPFIIKPQETILRDLAFASKYCRRQSRVFLMDGDALIIPQKRLVWTLEQIREKLPWVTRVGLYANGKSIRAKSDADLRELASLGLGIAYHAKPKVKENASQSISTIGLDGVLYFIGFKDSFISETN